MKIVANNKIKSNFHRRGREVIRANSKELAFLFWSIFIYKSYFESNYLASLKQNLAIIKL